MLDASRQLKTMRMAVLRAGRHQTDFFAQRYKLKK
jgi:hypothetical protein